VLIWRTACERKFGRSGGVLRGSAPLRGGAEDPRERGCSGGRGFSPFLGLYLSSLIQRCVKLSFALRVGTAGIPGKRKNSANFGEFGLTLLRGGAIVNIDVSYRA